MFAPKEWLAIGDADRFEQAIAIKKAAVVDQQGRSIDRDVLSVNECEHGSVGIGGVAF